MTGVAITASIVPRSHSRATTREVSRVPTSVMTMAMEPGTRKKRLVSSGLNQKRCSTVIGRGLSPCFPTARSAAQVATRALRIVLHEIGGVGLRAVDDDLESGVSSAAKSRRESRRNDYDAANAAEHQIFFELAAGHGHRPRRNSATPGSSPRDPASPASYPRPRGRCAYAWCRARPHSRTGRAGSAGSTRAIRMLLGSRRIW